MDVLSQIRSLMINNVSLIKIYACMKSRTFCQEAYSTGLLQISAVILYGWNFHPKSFSQFKLIQRLFHCLVMTLIQLTINMLVKKKRGQVLLDFLHIFQDFFLHLDTRSHATAWACESTLKMHLQHALVCIFCVTSWKRKNKRMCNKNA